MVTSKKTTTIICVVSFVILIIVSACAIGAIRSQINKAKNAADNAVKFTPKTKMMAIKAICQPTDYKETCESSLSPAGKSGTGDPKELVKLAFEAAVDQLYGVIMKSTEAPQNVTDPFVVEAYKTCHELLEDSIDDLRKCFHVFDTFDISELDDYLEDLETWLSAAITYQETCMDGFENTAGDAGDRMKAKLKMSGELTSNALAIVSKLSTVLKSIQLTPFFGQRRLLSDSKPEIFNGYPSWIGPGKRRLLEATPAMMKPDIVVAQDGSGKYKSINEALKDVPLNINKTIVIYIKEGTYQENVELSKSMLDVVLVGDGATKTKITGNRSHGSGFNTYKTATLAANGDCFIAKDIGIENTAGAIMHQAVALRVSGDMSIIYNCQIHGYQDTLYVHTHRQFYRDCTISGTIDFIFGNAAAVFQNCKLVVRKPLHNQACMVTAQGRTERHQTTAIVLQNCTITAAVNLLASGKPAKVFLGRPWKKFSRTIIMNSNIDGLIEPKGWHTWHGDMYLDTLWYAEYDNRGSGAILTKRVTWPGIKKITLDEASSFTPKKFLHGDVWIPAAGVPYTVIRFEWGRWVQKKERSRSTSSNGEDFGLWKMQIEDYLYQKKLYQPLSGKKLEEIKDNYWALLDRQALRAWQLIQNGSEICVELDY
ncbi:probable pectinesterase/pectinesterase inhibitor 58 [Cornus florida]|uniref:probable pectinesterase/pectinesterase inhibitor 58 n=1 Tax=Cornus florida TaxID=4283 RepID=UPI0028976C5B|nr:probable pectinesterase/pectinesterase inhibitor 58 [Cornus florida]